MNSKEKLFRVIQMYGFALDEIRIYLDTHPYDENAMRNYNKYENQYAALKREYESKFGLISPSDQYGDTRWDWVCDPWPWENSCDEKVDK